MTRRRALAMGVGALVAAGCSDDTERSQSAGPADVDTGQSTTSTTDGTPTATSPSSTTSVTDGPGPVLEAPLSAADFDPAGACSPTPEQTSGPFYLEADLVRRDITEGRPGSPLRLGLLVEDDDCRPIEAARVDVWHADLDGDYSAFIDDSAPDEEGRGTTFLRGTQMTGAEGIVDFLTVFPGWYPSRAVHIHVMVHLARNRVLTSQLYFSDDTIADAFSSPPYADRGLPAVPTSGDRIAGDVVGQGLQLTVSGDDAGRLALHRLVIPT